MYRAPRTTQERRRFDADRDDYREYRIKVRQKRSVRNLPETYDDISHCHQRSWKVYRKKKRRNGGAHGGCETGEPRMVRGSDGEGDKQ